ncbi:MULTISPECIES: hypothetical protein [unclassified Halorhabdus]|uniref:hypothetical protein n=1 Tax=unclassified Halorhabdus TaxID=2621901 RepID=UPI0023DA72A9|nr:MULTISPECIES: hypothetical protein [unclassified Halorhabdus]WEL18921.1 putative membrane protein [Halorhabdus sp. SVX81]WEL22753.1 putative membrane protein [Halorhabdus sp. BNX81]
MAGYDMGWRQALVWGLVGGLSFLVLLQGYELLTPERVDPLVKAGVALVVTGIGAVLAKFVEPRLRQTL